MNGKRWSDEENQVLEKYYFEGGLKECQIRLPYRSVSSIQKQAWRLRVTGRKGSWVNSEIKMLKKYYFSEGSIGVQKRLSQEGFIRTKASINLKATRLEIGGRKGRIPKQMLWKKFGSVVVLERLNNKTYPSGDADLMYLCICLKCCTEFTTSGKSLRYGDTTSCGCLRDEKSSKRWLKKKREDHWNWKGGITELHDSIRTCDRNLNWKKECRKRDNYTCQKCEAKGDRRFPVHHCRIPFWKILEELVKMKITNVNDIPNDSELWDIDNGITLCKKCHKEFHSIYGNAFIEEEFNNWLRDQQS